MNVLIAEDSDVLRQMLKTALTKWGYEVAVARDGEEAWKALKSDETMRLVILDWQMPGTKGIDVCRRVRDELGRRYRYTILLSERNDRESIIAALQAGADDFLAKPFDPDEMEQRLRAGMRILKLQDDLLATQETLKAQATHDALTGILNRGAIHDLLYRESDRCRREQRPISVVMADVDHFKRINDTYGHQAGDAILRHTAKLIRSSTRHYDTVGRYGGEEFMVVLPGVDSVEAIAIAERIRRRVSESPLSRNSDPIYLSLSLGVATSESNQNESLDVLVHKADTAMYRAKNDGRNCVRYDVEGLPVAHALDSRSKSRRHCETVLVVDNDAHVREIISQWLTEEGFAYFDACDARSALKYLQTGDVDLMTLDIGISGKSGLELLLQTKQQFAETEVIVLSALDKLEFAVEALACGGYGYVMKPVDRDILIDQVSKTLKHRQSRLDRRAYTDRLEKQIQEQTVAIRRAHEETIHRLITASMHRDEETGAHIRRVGLYSERMAEALGWPASKIEQIRMAAPMHDVGKIGIADAILRKPGKLTNEEYDIMKQHTVIGAKMLAGSDSPMLQMAHDIALSHHERWDGTGYTQRLMGTDIPEPARIVSIVDVFDALTHDRVYRPAFEVQKAFAMLLDGRETQFDPKLLDLFFSLEEEMLRISEENPDPSASSQLHCHEQGATIQQPIAYINDTADHQYMQLSHSTS